MRMGACSLMVSRLSRRHLLVGAGAAGVGLLACGRLPWGMGQTAKIPRIGWLQLSAVAASPSPILEAFRAGLQAQGYVEGQNIQIEERYAEGQAERLTTA